jgi:integrase/recombinase XerD
MMIKHNPNNERIKRKYLIFMQEAKRLSVPTIDAIAKSLSRFECYTKYRDFKIFRFEQAVAFKKHLAKQIGKQSGKKLSKTTLNMTLRHLKAFFQWLAMQPGYKSRLSYTDTEYFNLSDKDMRIATAVRSKPIPTLEQIVHVLHNMPNNTDIERRNRCLIAFTLLTGARDGAIASLKLKHVDLIKNCIIQDAREVNTKFSKSFTSYFFPVEDMVRDIVCGWLRYLREDLLFGNDDPLFPKTNIIVGASKTFESSGLKKQHWATASPIRAIFQQAFIAAGLPYYNPHSFRKTLVTLGEQICRTPEEFKSWSQNLGHEGVMTTFYSYGEVQPQRQADIFQKLKQPENNDSSNTSALAKSLAQEMHKLSLNSN